MDCNTPKQLPFSPERMIRGVDGSNSSRRHAKILQASDRHSFHGDARLFTFVYGVRVRTKFSAEFLFDIL